MTSRSGVTSRFFWTAVVWTLEKQLPLRSITCSSVAGGGPSVQHPPGFLVLLLKHIPVTSGTSGKVSKVP